MRWTTATSAARRLGAGAPIALALLCGVGTAAARADLPDNDIVIAPLDGKADEDGTAVVGNRQPRFLMQFNFGSTTQVHVECSTDSINFTSCGTQLTSSCRASQCWIYQPSFPSDGEGFKVEGAIFDSTLPDNDPNQPMDALNQPVVVNSTAPDTRITSSIPGFDTENVNRKGIPVAFPVRVIDDLDQDLWEDNTQCAVTTGAPPSSWVDCSRALRVPFTPEVFRFWARTVDFIGRPDPTPAESGPFSAIPCRSHLLGHPSSLRQIARQGLRIRVRCVQRAAYDISLQIPLKELITINLQHPDIGSQYLGHLSGRTHRTGESDVITLHLLRGIPGDLFADPKLSLDLDTGAGPTIEKPVAIHHVTGR